MDKRYQVFVSSTSDLIDERRAVMEALLKLGCMPAGMELFPASDEDSWTLITRQIDECDYYIVIVAGRYGSVSSDGLSFTEKEYDYAFKVGKPAMGFVHADPGSIPARYTDQDSMMREKLARFHAKLLRDRYCRKWKNAYELGAEVTTSLVSMFNYRPAVGWVSARYAKTIEEVEEKTNLLKQIQVLERELAALRRSGVQDTSGLAQGEDPVELKYSGGLTKMTTWNAVFETVATNCMNPVPGDEIWRQFTEKKYELIAECWRMIKLQLFALGLIEFRWEIRYKEGYSSNPVKYGDSISVPENVLVWALTETGRVALGNLAGVKRAAGG
jgi:hypothetical protein